MGDKMLDNRLLVSYNKNSIPSNSFINWIVEKYNNKDIIFDTHYFECKKVIDVLSIKDIENWKSYKPVCISSQTGTGKNYFVQHVLVKYIIEYNKMNEDKKSILILSNRVALNRQSKLDYANIIFQLTGNREIYDKLENLFTFRGFDKFCLDFDEYITICSYHQLIERRILDRKYTYIVCDEAHFFVQDSTMNLYTDDILRYIINKGKDSIRIYMSATLNLSMECILREEYKSIEKKNKEFKNYRYNFYVSHAQNSFELLYRENNKYSLYIDLYYFKRNYDYIESVYEFNNLDELTDCINRSKERWLVFVKSKNDGEYLHRNITRSAVFLSRENIDRNKELEKEYNYIIENQTYNKDVLITTSLLDNGININGYDRPIRNIVLFSLDKTQFLQMLGRVRINNEKINIFLYNYNLNQIKYYLDKVVEDLVIRLANDLWDAKDKKKNFNTNYYKFLENNHFSDYNDYSIIKLLDQCKRLLDMNLNGNKIIYNLNKDIESYKNKILLNIKTIWINKHEYSGDLYRIFENPYNIKEDYFDFESFFMGRVLIDYFLDKMSIRTEQLLKLLHTITQNKILSDSNEITNDLKRILYRLNTTIYELSKQGLHIQCIEQDYPNLIEEYKSLVEVTSSKSTIKEQLHWLKYNRKVNPIQDYK